MAVGLSDCNRASPLESEPEGLLATRLIALAAEQGTAGLIVVARSDTRAARLHAAARALAPGIEAVLLPGWDCLPYDRVSPSRHLMGARMAVLRALAAPVPRNGRLVIASVEAAMQRLPPPLAWAEITLAVGEAIDPVALEGRLRRLGYLFEDPVNAPGEAAVRGEVADVFPPTTDLASRIEYADGRITSIRHFDPLSQRSAEEQQRAAFGPASELLSAEDAPEEPLLGAEHRLAEHYSALGSPPVSLFELVPDAPVVCDPEVESLYAARWAEIEEFWRARLAARSDAAAAAPPSRLYLDPDAWAGVQAGRRVIAIAEAAEEPEAALPDFRATADPEDAMLAFVEAELEAGRRVGIAAAARDRLVRALARAVGREPQPLGGWQPLCDAPPGTLARLSPGLGSGFAAREATVIAPADVRFRRPATSAGHGAAALNAEPELRPGDTVIHLDHGLGALGGIETLELDGMRCDTLRLDYANGTSTLAPVSEVDRIWRYGASAEGLSLDRLGGDAWQKRRANVFAEIAETARRMVGMAREREQATAPVMRPPRRAYARFAARFPYEPTPDQSAAVEAVLRDLGSGRPMDRLVCGDVGFGKTEIALRAAAVAALSGWQVAVLAPTTVLVRQHLATFRRRFAGFDIGIAGLSLLTSAAEARAVKAGLAGGRIGVVIGTHALAGRGVRFHKLGLLVIDEEHRFGARQKQALRRLRQDVHVLTLTATPIPRTLQSALVGLQELSVLATPPVRRQPVQTMRAPVDPVTIGNALRRESRRGGQSFVVCPRIEDLPRVRPVVAQAAPGLELIEVHGKLPPDEADEAIVRFANGECDVLLATDIIEAGLDVPRANTMLVWGAEQFGLAQLHQLRGRVGRGRARGVMYLMTDPGRRLNVTAERRLRALEALDRLGAGFAISARDMDLRGAGELFGDEQSGHMRLVGIDLYRHMLQGALRRARGEPEADEWTPELALAVPAFIPVQYVPDPALRVGLHVRLGALYRHGDRDGIDDLAEEIEDRFGQAPEPMESLLGLARLRARCRRMGVARLEVGPAAAAATLRGDAPADAPPGLERRGERLLLRQPSATPAERLRAAEAILDLLSRRRRRNVQASAS